MSYYFTIHLPKVWVISECSVARLRAAFTDHSASLIFFSVAQKPEMHIRNAAQHVDVQKCLHDRSSNMFYSNNIVSDKDKRSCRFPINHNPTTTTTKNKKTKKTAHIPLIMMLAFESGLWQSVHYKRCNTENAAG